MSGKPKKPVAENGKFRLLEPYGRYTSYRIEWYNESTGQTDGISTRTTDLQRAQEAFSQHHLTHSQGSEATQSKDEPAAQALARYFLAHAGRLASANTARTAMNSANEFFKGLSVRQIDANRQLAWITSLRAGGVADSTITRWLGVVFAAFNYAVTFKHITADAVQPRLGKRLWGTRTTARKRPCGDASRRQLSLQELGALCDVTQGRPNGLRYFILALGTGGRPSAVVRLTAGQYDAAHGVLDLNPPGREQNNKYYPRIPVAPILGQWLASWSPRIATGHYLARRGEPIGTKNFFRKYIAESGVRDCVPYTLRHTVASWLSGQGVPKWERSRFLGHSRPDGNTTDDYSHYDPVYLRSTANAIQKLFAAVAPYTQVDLMRHIWEDQGPTDGAWLGQFLTEGPRLMCPDLGREGVEPSTNRLKAECSTAELSPHLNRSTHDPLADPSPSVGPASTASPRPSDTQNPPALDLDPCPAWYQRGTASAEQEENPLKSTSSIALKSKVDTLKGPTDGN